MSTDATRSNVRELYVQAARIEEHEARQAFLNEACGNRIELRQRVEQLLTARPSARPTVLQLATTNSIYGTSSLSFSADDSGQTIGSNHQAAEVNRTRDDTVQRRIDDFTHHVIRRYELLFEIGQGGMGTVYMAQQTEPVHRKVALKIIKPGMDSKEVIARFEAERQTLAMLDHPNVAKVYDGGTTDAGRPFFVMELVCGTPVTQFCDEHRLSIRQRLTLFIDICHAVQHAHMKGVIHRDLKPSNVMVTMNDGKPIPKVIDFGVSKALSQSFSDKTVFTAFGQMIGTPLYMSPEQARFSAQDVDVRSDVYSLGVLLYELLSGNTPFDREMLRKSGLDEMRRMICDVEPVRPSARISTQRAEVISTVADRPRMDDLKLRQSLQGELDWIVMKALEKDRERRYESANAFAADVQRYLNDEPVEAYPPSTMYRLKKQAQRHKGLLATVAAIAVTLMVATGVSLAFAFQATVAQKQAESEQGKALLAQKQSDQNFEAALSAIVKLLDHASSPELNEVPQSQPIRRKMIEDVLGFYNSSVEQLGDNQELRHQAAKTWLMLAQVALSLSDEDQAREAYDKSLKLAAELVKQDPESWPYRATKIAILHDKGYFHLWERHEFTQTKKCFEDSLAEVRDVKLGRSQGRFAKADDLGLAIREINEMMGLANLARMTGNWQERRRIVMEAYRLANAPGFDWRPTRTHIEAEMAQIKKEEDPHAAARHFKKAIKGFGEIVKEDPMQQHQRYLFDTLNNAARFFRNRDRALAEHYASQAVDIVEQQANKFPDMVEYWTRLWDYMNTYIAIVETTLTDTELAAKFEKYDKYLIHEPENFYFYKHRICVQYRLGNYEQVLADMRQAIGIDPEWATLINQPSATSIAACPDKEFRKRVLELANEAVDANPNSSKIRGARAVLQLAMGRTQDARNDLDFMYALGDIDDSWGHAIALVALAGEELGAYRQSCKDMLDYFGDSEDPEIQFRVAWTCALSPNALDDYDRAIALARSSVESDRSNPQYLEGLGAILTRAGNYAEARVHLEKSLEVNNDITSPSYIHYFLAMTRHALGDTEEAQAHLRLAKDIADSALSDSPSWNRSLTLELLRKETELQLAPPTVVAGK